jgi:curved DNA-binding protein
VDLTISLADAYHGTSHGISLDLVSTSPEGEETHTTKSYEVKIPPGTTEGSVIRLAGQGGPGSSGGASGDLLITVHVAPDPKFQLSGHNLLTTVPITPWEAALGAKISLPLLGGDATVTVPPGTPSGQKLRLRGKGLPIRASKGEKGSHTHGDVLMELRIMVPKELTDEERRLFEELKAKSEFNPRSE